MGALASCPGHYLTSLRLCLSLAVAELELANDELQHGNAPGADEASEVTKVANVVLLQDLFLRRWGIECWGIENSFPISERHQIQPLHYRHAPRDNYKKSARKKTNSYILRFST